MIYKCKVVDEVTKFSAGSCILNDTEKLHITDSAVNNRWVYSYDIPDYSAEEIQVKVTETEIIVYVFEITDSEVFLLDSSTRTLESGGYIYTTFGSLERGVLEINVPDKVTAIASEVIVKIKERLD